MPRGKPVTIGQHHWSTKKEALSFYKAILNKYEPSSPLTKEHYHEIFMLLKNHPKAVQKLKDGISDIRVEADGYGGKCFHIVRPDGSYENFSYIKCVNG